MENSSVYFRIPVAKIVRGGACSLFAGLALAGCGGVSPGTVFSTAEQFTTVSGRSVSLGNTFVKFDGTVPFEIGWEFPAGMLDNLPDSRFGEPAVYFLSFPSQLVNTPFKVLVFSDWATGHPPVGTGDAPHIHPIFLMAPVLPPSANFAVETTPIANPDEVPTNYVFSGSIPGVGATVAPGIGVLYDEYPAGPDLQPGWNSTALNYWAYNGHINGIGSGATYDFLKNKRTESLTITQPKVYPHPGWYPTKQTIRFNAANNSYVIVLTDFVEAKSWVSGG